MIRAGSTSINPAFVQFMEWDRSHYAYGGGRSFLVIHFENGKSLRLEHNPGFYNEGVDCFEVEKAILAAHEAASS